MAVSHGWTRTGNAACQHLGAGVRIPIGRPSGRFLRFESRHWSSAIERWNPRDGTGPSLQVGVLGVGAVAEPSVSELELSGLRLPRRAGVAWCGEVGQGWGLRASQPWRPEP